jgi:uncharacterized membrane protein
MNASMQGETAPASRLVRFGSSFSFVGLAFAALFFAESLTPSLLPRTFLVQGILSGFALAVGYGVGVLFVWLWLFLELPRPKAKVQTISKALASAAAAVVVAAFLQRATVWQNSVRQLMEMEPVATAYPWRVAGIALVVGVLLIAAARAVAACWRMVDRKIRRVAPPRVSYFVSAVVVVLALFLIANKVVAGLALTAADALFRRLDRVVDEGIERPKRTTASGGPESLVEWGSIGRYGKEFVAAGPKREEIADFWGRDVQEPLRVYVGLNSRDTPEERAKLAVDELVRVGGFDRSILVVATPTGTGWLDPGAVDSVEYLHAGDTAIVAMQYSYLPSWITILVDPARVRDSARYLFEAVYGRWKTLPKRSRPRLYVHGLSLGALGSAAAADLFTVFEDPIHGGVWSGPPFPSDDWSRAVHYRNPGSPMWLPKFRDGSMLRFSGRTNALPDGGRRWGPMRFVYLQHASDPMSFFSPDLLYRRPDWLEDPRGPDVSPYLTWRPIVTFLQVGFDIPMATTVPMGYGHNFAPAAYIDAWVEVSQPKDWSEEKTRRLKKILAR